MAGTGRAAEGGILRPGAPARVPVPVRLHLHARAGGHDWWGGLRSPALSFRADLLQLGDRLSLLLRELRDLERRSAGGTVGTGGGAGGPPDRPLNRGGLSPSTP